RMEEARTWKKHTHADNQVLTWPDMEARGRQGRRQKVARPGAAGERMKAACVARAPQKSNLAGWLVTPSGPTDLLASFSKNHRSLGRGSSPPLTSGPESISRGDAGTVAFEAVTPGSDVLQ